MSEANEKECAAITKVVKDVDRVSIVAYWGNGIAKHFNLKANPLLDSVQPNDMCFFTAYDVSSDGTKQHTIFGKEIQGNRVYIRLDESTGAGFYADLDI